MITTIVSSGASLANVFSGIAGGYLSGKAVKEAVQTTRSAVIAETQETGAYLRNRGDQAFTHLESRANDFTEAGIATFHNTQTAASQLISDTKEKIENVSKTMIVGIDQTTSGAKRVTDTAQVQLQRVGDSTDRELSRAGESLRNETRRAGDEVRETANVARDEIRTTWRRQMSLEMK